MPKWNFIIDLARCENCNNCLLTNKDEYVDNTFEGYSLPQPRHGHKWIQITTRERGSGSLISTKYLVTFCNQCDLAPCMSAARDNAVIKRADGIVLIDPVKAKGQKQIVDACPYGQIFWNEEYNVPQKWSWDAHLLDQGWSSPRSEQVCPTSSLAAVKCSDEEMLAEAAKKRLERLKPELNTKPRVWYKNLHLFTKEFIAGSIARVENGVEDNVKGASVILKKDGKDIAGQTTDYFGDFKFDGLDADSGEYEFLVTSSSNKVKSFKHKLEKSVYLGALRIE